MVRGLLAAQVELVPHHPLQAHLSQGLVVAVLVCGLELVVLAVLAEAVLALVVHLVRLELSTPAEAAAEQPQWEAQLVQAVAVAQV
jgi:hypothetical protein